MPMSFFVLQCPLFSPFSVFRRADPAHSHPALSFVSFRPDVCPARGMHSTSATGGSAANPTSGAAADTDADARLGGGEESKGSGSIDRLRTNE